MCEPAIKSLYRYYEGSTSVWRDAAATDGNGVFAAISGVSKLIDTIALNCYACFYRDCDVRYIFQWMPIIVIIPYRNTLCYGSLYGFYFMISIIHTILQNEKIFPPCRVEFSVGI
jgi:hypothetical protein